MNAREITIALKPVGGVKYIAEQLSVKPPTVSQVIHGVRPGYRVRLAIAEAIGRPVEEIWPDDK